MFPHITQHDAVPEEVLADGIVVSRSRGGLQYRTSAVTKSFVETLAASSTLMDSCLPPENRHMLGGSATGLRKRQSSKQAPVAEVKESL